MESPAGFQISQLLELMLQTGASDLHLKAGSAPGLRVDGRLQVALNAPQLQAEDIRRLALEIIPPNRRAELDEQLDIEFSYDQEGVSRYRVSVLRQRGSLGLVLRRIPVEVPDVDRIGLPDVVKELAAQPRGLVLVTGPTGSGKSTTLAAIINYLNRYSHGHILSMEDPIEFVHQDQSCFITQREIGIDCANFQQALRRALRQDPDIIMIGELRDLETMSLAVTAAETGHLVFATLHTTSAVQTVDRILDAFPPAARDQARMQLSVNLQGVISQTLVRKTTGGRAAAFEILVATEAVRSCIREGKTHQLLNLIQTGAQSGMQTLDVSLADLVRAGAVRQEDATAKSSSPKDFVRVLTSGGMPLRALPRSPLESAKSSALPGPVRPMETSPASSEVPPAPEPEPEPEPAPGESSDPASKESILARLRRS
jgi:twitching motility protein PilT